MFCTFLSLLNYFSKKFEKLFNESSSAEIRPPKVPEIALKIKLHGSARPVKLSHDISGEKNEMNTSLKSKAVRKQRKIKSNEKQLNFLVFSYIVVVMGRELSSLTQWLHLNTPTCSVGSLCEPTNKLSFSLEEL